MRSHRVLLRLGSVVPSLKVLGREFLLATRTRSTSRVSAPTRASTAPGAASISSSNAGPSGSKPPLGCPGRARLRGQVAPPILGPPLACATTTSSPRPATAVDADPAHHLGRCLLHRRRCPPDDHRPPAARPDSLPYPSAATAWARPSRTPPSTRRASRPRGSRMHHAVRSRRAVRWPARHAGVARGQTRAHHTVEG